MSETRIGYEPNPLYRHIDELQAEVARLQLECAELNELFDVRQRADMRAIERWRAGHPERELRQPDHADLVVWLGEENARYRKALETIAGFEWDYPVARQALGRTCTGERCEDCYKEGEERWADTR